MPRTRSWVAANPSLAIGVFALACLVYFGLGLQAALRHERLRTDGLSTKARVVSAEPGRGLFGAHYVATYTFQTADGATITGEQRVSPGFFANLRGNDTRIATYLPGQPDEHEIEGEFLADGAIMSAVVGFGGVLLSVVVAFRLARQPRQG